MLTQPLELRRAATGPKKLQERVAKQRVEAIPRFHSLNTFDEITVPMERHEKLAGRR